MSTLARGVSLRAAPLTLPELPDSLSAGFPANFSKRYDRGLLHGMGTVLGGLAQTGALLWKSGVRNAVSDCFSEANRLTVDSPDCGPPADSVSYNRSMQLIVYSAWWCPDCRAAKAFLKKHNIPYTEIDIETTPGAAQEVVRHAGKRAIPQFVIDGRWVQPYRPGEGFLYEEMSELLGIVDEG